MYDDVNFSHSVIVGRKFRCLQPAFVKPYLSSDYGIYLGSNLSEVTERWPVTNVTAKIQFFINLGDIMFTKEKCFCFQYKGRIRVI